MVARNAREILKKENEMLDDLVERATEFAKQTVDKEFVDDLNSWVDDLVGYREINQNLINMTDDKAFDDALGEEITILGSHAWVRYKSEQSRRILEKKAPRRYRHLKGTDWLMACFGWYIDEEICEKLRSNSFQPSRLDRCAGQGGRGLRSIVDLRKQIRRGSA